MAISWARRLEFISVLLPFFVSIVAAASEQTLLNEVKSAGYAVELHKVETPDGYSLKIMRLPGPPSSGGSKPVVFLMHGLVNNCGCFLVLRNSIAYVMADQGFDVWMGNARGTLNGQHRFKSRWSKDFWNFSLDEIGLIDVPTMIDYTLNYTRQSRLYYVGYSQGGTSFLQFTAELPEYNDKIIAAGLIAPAAFLVDAYNDLIRYLAENQELIEDLLRFIGMDKLEVPDRYLDIIANACDARSRHKTFCYFVFYTFYGQASEKSFKLHIPRFIRLGFDVISVNQLAQFGQYLIMGKFKKYKFRDQMSNYMRYRQFEPPEYNLGAIRVPLLTFHGTSDTSVSPPNARRLHRELKSVQRKLLVKDYNHIDFVLGVDMKADIYDVIIKFFRGINGSGTSNWLSNKI